SGVHSVGVTFFFSSRRRHTRFSRDWSSDVCSSDLFKDFIAHNELHQRIYDRLAQLDVEDVNALTAAGREIRQWVIDAPLQPALDADIRTAYARLCSENGGGDIAVAVRSSATAEDLP